MEENQYLALDIEDVKSWTYEQQKRAGFDISSPNLGYIDFLNPIEFLKGEAEKREYVKDLDPLEGTKQSKEL
jgi:hypothetical protein